MDNKSFFSNYGLKKQILLLSLLPSFLITALLTSYLIIIHQSDVQSELIRQITATINYLAKSSELGLFSGNKHALQEIANTTQTNSDIKSVTFFNADKKIILNLGGFDVEPKIMSENDFFAKERDESWIFQKAVLNLQPDVEDFPVSKREEGVKNPIQYLGWVQVVADKKRLKTKRLSIIKTGATIGLLLFSLFSVLVYKFSKKITAPLEHITATVKQLEAGDLTARVKINADGELKSLINGINRLSEGVAQSNEQLQKRVDRAVIKLTQTLSELEDKNNKLKQTGIQLIQANKAKDDFLANMSHELRTPLTAILGYARLLKKSDLQQNQISYTKVINQASTMLLSLIDNILDFSKLKSGSIELESAPFNLELLLDDVLDLHLPEARAKGIKLIVTVDLDVPLALIGDELRIKQIINNLIRNAIKFTPEGEVKLSVSLLSDIKNNEEKLALQFTICDTGIGMDLNQSSGLFQPFYQAEPSISRRFGGTGLGLMICKQLVDLFSGDIHVESEKGKGTKIVFTIKKIQLQEEGNELKQLPFEQIEKSSGLFKKTILIAEDNIFIKELLEMILQSEGATVVSVSNGSAALEKCREVSFDLVMLDYNMPKLNGYEASKQIRKDYPASKLPIFLITADILHVKKLDLKGAGINEIIYKPINEQKLLQSVMRYTSNIQVSKSQKVLDYLPDELIFKELRRLFTMLQQFVSDNDYLSMKKYAHEICGIAGPSTKYQTIEQLVRKMECEIENKNSDAIERLMSKLKEIMDEESKQ